MVGTQRRVEAMVTCSLLQGKLQSFAAASMG